MSAAANSLPSSGDLDVRAVDAGEREHDGRVGQREQVVDLEAEVVGDLREAVPAAAGGENFEQSGQPAGADVGQRCVDGGSHGPDRLSWRGLRGGLGLERVGGGLFTAGDDAVDVVEPGLEPGAVPIARAGQVDRELGPIRPGFEDSTSTRSARSTASSMLWVTIRIDLVGNAPCAPTT